MLQRRGAVVRGDDVTRGLLELSHPLCELAGIGYGCRKENKIDLTKKVPGKETTVTRFENKDGSITTELWKVVDGAHVTRPSGDARELIIRWLLNKKKP